MTSTIRAGFRGTTLLAMGSVFCLTMVAQIAAASTTVADRWAPGQTSGLVKDTESLSSDGNSVTISFYGGGAVGQSTGEAEVIPSTADAATGFTGNYSTAGAQSISLDVSGAGASSGPGTRIQVIANGNEYANYNVNVNGPNVISLDYATGQWWGGNAASWDADLADVTAVSVIISKDPNAAGATSFTISDFTLTSDRTLGSNSLTPLEQALAEAFEGATSVAALTQEQLEQDDNNNGVLDVDEVRYQYERTYFATRFIAEVVAVDASGITVRFPCVPGAQYEVRRAAVIDDATSFDGAPIHTVTIPVDADPSDDFSYTFKDTNAGGGPAFYVVDELDR